jgi:hypothetical protein
VLAGDDADSACGFVACAAKRREFLFDLQQMRA